jgi:hypothetical protein
VAAEDITSDDESAMDGDLEVDFVPRTAQEVKERLRARHPATQLQGRATVPGAWTCVEEYAGLDLLAFSAQATPASGAQRPPKGARYPRVGYEVKVSRADLRQELLHPEKRLRARLLCHELYLAVPKGLLRPDELAFKEPAHFGDPKNFVRKHCPNHCAQVRYRNRRRSGPYMVLREGFDWGSQDFNERHILCPVCAGKGYLEKSRVELEAPQLWVPQDVGLVEVSHNCRVIRSSPVNHDAELPLDDRGLGDLVRWVSARPDPRHSGVVQGARETQRVVRKVQPKSRTRVKRARRKRN